MIQCEGQMNMMDLLITTVVSEPPILLSEGQRVYKVIRGDIVKCIVGGRTWICGGNNRGYDLDNGMTWNTQINKVVFAEREPAERVAERYLAEHEHILNKDIHPVKIVAYRYEYNNHEIVNFYAVLESGEIYFKYGSMYQHIGKEDEITKFEEDRRNHIESDGYMELEEYQPELKNMYKCNHRSWLYAEARYEYFDA